MITIVDYGMGNIQSLKNAFESLGQKVKFAKTKQEIEQAEKLVFPGVGSFGRAMEVLRTKRLDVAIVKHIGQKKLFLGICLGFQLLFQKSEESPDIRGLSIFQGNIVRFKKGKIPHMGWNQISMQKQSRLFRNIPDKSFVYFMHSFYPKPKDKSLAVADTFYEENFCSAIESENVFAVQFHPEKSGEVGMRILKNFCDLPC
jgi:imidazole glycerol phosphate synthase glutamine amidotransferase subunit